MRPTVEMVGNRIHLTSEFKHKDQAKSVIGARWSPKDRVWTYPLELETCRRLRDAFGEDLVIGQALWGWSKQQVEREKTLTSMIDLSKIDMTEVVDLPNVRTQAPTMWAAMQQRPYQPIASRYMALARRCLNGDQPGIGKTIETLGALVEAGVTGPVLVLAPKTSALTVWPAEIHKWLADDVPHTVHNIAGLTPAKRANAWGSFLSALKDPTTMHIMIANAEQVGIKKFTECPDGICDGDEDWCPSLDKHVNKSEKRRPFLHSVAWNAVVADETHKWLINTRGKSASQVGYGFTRLPVTEDALMFALSGTPLKGKKWNIFGTINWLFPKTHTSKWRFIETFWRVETDAQRTRGGGSVEVRHITGDWVSPKAKQAFFRTLGTVMIRRTKAELRAINPAWMPPEKRYHDVYLPMESKQATHYRAMEKAQAVVIKGQRLTATGILAEMTRLKQFACSDGEIVEGNFTPTLPSNKFTWLLEFLEERGIEQKAGSALQGDLSDDVRKVVVASQFTSLINLWSAELVGRGINVVSITGETSDSNRAEHMRAFQENPSVRVCLINTMAGGVSITLDAADDIVLMDETWVPDDMEQVEDRVHRASNVEHQVDVWYVRSADTIEELIATANVDKAINNHVVLDAQRGLAFARAHFGATTKEEQA